jgi:hypothetical protein
MSPEEAFRRAWGREPARAELERLRRLQNAFEIDENDALLTIAMVLEFYESHFRVYPGKCADAASNGIKRWLESSEGIATLQRAAGGRRSSSDAASPALSGAAPDALSSEARREIYWVTLGGLATATSAVSGALGMVVGAASAGRYPCWVPQDAATSVAANVVGAPMGWLVLLALLVPSYYAARWGWCRGRESHRRSSERSLGWASFAAVVISTIGWAVLIVRVTLT